MKKFFCYLLEKVLWLIIKFAAKQLFSQRHRIISGDVIIITGVIRIRIAVIRY